MQRWYSLWRLPRHIGLIAGARMPRGRDMILTLDLARPPVTHRKGDFAALDAHVGKCAPVK
jgi:hypothetical protein